MPRIFLIAFIIAGTTITVALWFDLFIKWKFLKLLIVLGSVDLMLALVWSMRILNKVGGIVDSIRTKDCDAEKFLEATKAILEYGEQHSKTKNVYMYIKEYYAVALLVNKKYDEAKNYINTQKFPANTITRKRLNANLNLRRAYDNNDVKSYANTFLDAPKAFNNEPLFVSYGFMLDKNYKKAIEVLLAYEVKNIYQDVLRRFTLAEAYLNLKDKETAREHLQFVIENGNTLPCRYEANALYMKNYTEEGEQ